MYAFYDQDDSDERAAMLAIAKRRKGCPYPEQNKDEEDGPDSYTNRIVGAADSYNLEV